MNEYISTTSRGSKFYYKDKEMTICHREDGPAFEYANGDRSWWLNGKCHRIDGPAVEMRNGNRGWYVNGVFIFAVDKDGKLIRRMK